MINNKRRYIGRKVKKHWRIFAFGLILSVAPLCSARTYSTTFCSTENPISEGGNWINGGTTGLDWHDMATDPGCFAYNVNGSGVSDGTAVLSGSWGTNQTITLVVRCIGADPTAEIEGRLLTTITAHSITGYELDMSCGTGFIRFVRWNGPFNNFTILNSALNGVATGDVIVGSVDSSCNFTVTKNGTLVSGASVTDCTYRSGSPGIGSEQNTPPGTPNGVSSFTATDGLTGTNDTLTNGKLTNGKLQ